MGVLRMIKELWLPEKGDGKTREEVVSRSRAAMSRTGRNLDRVSDDCVVGEYRDASTTF